MRYKLTNIKIHKLLGGCPTGSFMYLECELFDDTDIRNNPGTLPKWVCDAEAFVKMFIPYTNDDETVDVKRLENDIKCGKIEDILHIDNMFRIIVQISGKYVPVMMQKINGEWASNPRCEAQALIDRGYFDEID